MDERDKQILKELSEILVNFRRCLNNEEKNRGNWQPNDDWINEVHYPTQEDVNAITGVLGIVDRLNSQLADLKDAGEPFVKVAAHIESHLSDCWIIYSTSLLKGGEHVTLQIGNIRRLAQALDKIEEVRNNDND